MRLLGMSLSWIGAQLSQNVFCDNIFKPELAGEDERD